MRRFSDLSWAFSVCLLATTSCLAACSAAPDDTGTGDAETGDDEEILAGRRLPPAEVASLLRSAGVPERDVARLVCTAKYESSFYAGAQNKNRNGSIDYGLLQVNDRFWLKPCGVTGRDLLDPATNVRCAKKIYDAQGLGAWYGYKAHRGECDRYVIPADTGAEADIGCRSATLGARVDQGACVQSRSDGRWYQCSAGRWVGISAPTPARACTSEHPLE